MLEVGSLAIRNGMEYSHSRCVCFFRLGEMKGWVMQRKGKERDKRINRITKFLLLLAGFVVWMAHLQYMVQYSTQWSQWMDRQAE